MIGGEIMKKWKWLIILVICTVAGVLGFYFLPLMHDTSPITILAIVLGLYGAGYAASRLDANMRPVKIHVGVKDGKPHMTVTPLGE